MTFDIKYRDECAGVIISELCLVLRCESKSNCHLGLVKTKVTVSISPVKENTVPALRLLCFYRLVFLLETCGEIS